MTAWRECPPPPPTPAVRIPLAIAVLAAWVPVIIHASRLVRLDGTQYSAWRALLLLGIALVLVVVARRRPLWAMIGVPAGVLVGYGCYGARPGVLLGWTAAAGAVAWSIATGWSPIRRWLEPSVTVRRLAAVPLGVATLIVVLGSGDVRISAVSIAVALVVELIGDRHIETLQRWSEPIRSAFGPLLAGLVHLMEVIGRPLGALFGALAMVPVAVIVTIAWMVNGLLRFDPFFVPSGWLDRDRGDLHPDRLYGGVKVLPLATRRVALHRGVASLAVLAVVAAASGAGIRLIRSDSNDPGPFRGESAPSCTVSCLAFDDQPDWQRTFDETSAVLSQSRYDAASLYYFADHAGVDVNERARVRRTWRPPECGCRRIRVWWFGASSAWGFFQRDEYTLPSYVARVAWEQGIALDIENRAMPGWTVGQSVRAIADLTTTAPAPDVVISMDGANDLAAQFARNDVGRGTDESDSTMLESKLTRLVRTGLYDWAKGEAGPTNGDDPKLTPEQVAQHAVARYTRSVDLGRRVVESVGAVPLFLWQPSAASSPLAAGDPTSSRPPDFADWQAASAEVARRLPPGVVDLSTAYEGVDDVVFGDLVHTNEAGAEILARVIVGRIAPLVSRTEPG